MRHRDGHGDPAVVTVRVAGVIVPGAGGLPLAGPGRAPRPPQCAPIMPRSGRPAAEAAPGRRRPPAWPGIQPDSDGAAGSAAESESVTAAVAAAAAAAPPGRY